VLWIKAVHIIFMVTWFSGLFYLPRLFVYHSMSQDVIGIERFKIMERKLFYGIMTPGGVLTIIFGLWLWANHAVSGQWMHIKFSAVLLLIVYHIYCGKLLHDFKNDRNKRGHVFYRFFNELPVIIMVIIIILVVVKPV